MSSWAVLGPAISLCLVLWHIDLLVDLPDGASLFDRAELKSALEELLLTRVDLIRRRNLKPSVKAVVEAEAVSL